MKTVSKRVIFYFVLYCFICFYILIISPFTANDTWNYGFSYGLIRGEMFYKDFNMVIGPFYPLLMAFPLLFSNTYLSFILFHGIWMVFFYYLLEKNYSFRSFLAFLLMLFFPSLMGVSYNTFMLLCIVLLITLEKSQWNKKDFFIGCILSIGLFTKQSTGFLLFLPTIIFWKKVNWKQRILGFLLPSCFLIGFLVWKNAFLEYLSFCFLGLLEFGSHNTSFDWLPFLLFLGIVICSIYLFWKKRDNISLLYYGMGYSLCLPILDSLHLFYGILLFLLFLFEVGYFSSFSKKQLLPFCVLMIGILGIEGSFLFTDDSKYPHTIHPFEYRYSTKEEKTFIQEMKLYLKDKEFVLFSDQNYFYKIILQKPIGFLDIVNYGNSGYDGTERLLNEIKKHPDIVYLLPKNAFIYKQLDQDCMNYVISNASKTGEVGEYEIYEFR